MRSELPRVGTGVDVHPLSDDRPLWLGGLHWPGERGCLGHSDGDVAAHAVCDAVLAACGMGDLGHQFGIADPQWEGASGLALIEEVRHRVRAAGFEIGNVSVVIIGERPKVGPRRTDMEHALSSVLDGAAVSISATTTDGLGLTGRGEGLAAVATALVVATTHPATDGLLQ